MGIRLFVAGALILAARPATPQRRPETKVNPDARLASDRRAIEELHRRDITTAKAYDVETLVSLWTDDIVALAPSAAPIVGKSAGRATTFEVSARPRADGSWRIHRTIWNSLP